MNGLMCNSKRLIGLDSTHMHRHEAKDDMSSVWHNVCLELWDSGVCLDFSYWILGLSLLLLATMMTLNSWMCHTILHSYFVYVNVCESLIIGMGACWHAYQI